MCAYTQISIPTYISLLFHLRGPRSNAIPTAVSIPNAQILASNTILHERNQGCLEKWSIQGLEQEIYKMSLEHSVAPRNKELLKKIDVS